MVNYKEFLRDQKSNKKYLIIGKDVNNKSFKITTTTPWHYNIYKGNIWQLEKDGSKKLIKKIFNFWKGIIKLWSVYMKKRDRKIS